MRKTDRKMASKKYTEKSEKQTSITSKSTNSFANDGSFLELYKQRIQEQENTTDEKKDVKVETEKRKATPTNLLLQGKRKIPVGRMPGSSKQLDAKKKKQEKGKKKEPENPDEKSSAWKAYMEEVKKYKEMSCTDDSEQNRPLVK